MEKIEKAMERRGASIVWAGRELAPALSGGQEIIYRYG